MPTKIEPFQILQIDENRFFVNGGDVINYYNPYRRKSVRFDRDSEILKKIHENEVPDNDHVFTFESTDKLVFVTVVCQFEKPKYWTSGLWFMPNINKAWIQLIRISEDNLVSYTGETNVEEIDNIAKFRGSLNNYICCVGVVQKLPDNNGEQKLTIEQFWHDDIFFAEWQDSNAFYNNTISDSLLFDMRTALPLLEINKLSYRKGYCLPPHETLSDIFI